MYVCICICIVCIVIFNVYNVHVLTYYCFVNNYSSNIITKVLRLIAQNKTKRNSCLFDIFTEIFFTDMKQSRLSGFCFALFCKMAKHPAIGSGYNMSLYNCQNVQTCVPKHLTPI